MTRPMMVLYVVADEDEPLRKKLETHLALLVQQGKMQGWHAQHILAGSVREQRWEKAMK